ncbi:kinesin-like protein KIF25 isoform X1 [Ascaphus truei]|uniref:kinesin-like protein KIF25 isoform X1 n=1 Tax=Ascaphus truei TaxID=8439 RepID=UPI003F59BD13
MSPAVINLPFLYQERIKQLEHKLRAKEERIVVLETENAALHLKLAECRGQTGRSGNEAAQFYELYKEEKSLRTIMNIGIVQLHITMQSLTQSLQNLRLSAVEHAQEIQHQFKHYFQLLLNPLQMMQTKNQFLQELQARVTILDESFQEVSERYKKEKQRRKILHNRLIELKGNIRVNCRIRPLLPFDRQADSLSIQDRHGDFSEVTFSPDDETVLVKCCRPGHPITDRTFQFERVFSACESQHSVFEEVRPLLTSVLDGYNVCIMAYGQTGSGKTYTMMGPHSDDNATLPKEMCLGIIPRAAEELFWLILEKPPGSYYVEVSIIEVYNNDIFDLLAQDCYGELGVKRDVITTKEGKIEVPFLTYESVENAVELLNLVQKGLQLRVKQPTLVHAHSSRSHLVVTLTIKTYFASSHAVGLPDGERLKKQTTMKLQLVDLAGSECVGMSGVKGAALRETSFINRSLSALSDVLGALSEQRSHIPYRNSRLTHLLQDSIGGDAKLLVMLCISPCQRFTTESLQTLGFGTRARQVSRAPAKKINQTLCNKSK